MKERLGGELVVMVQKSDVVSSTCMNSTVRVGGNSFPHCRFHPKNPRLRRITAGQGSQLVSTGGIIAQNQFPIVVGLGTNALDGLMKKPSVTVPGGNQHRDQGTVLKPPARQRLFVENIRSEPVKTLPVFGIGFDGDASRAPDVGDL